MNIKNWNYKTLFFAALLLGSLPGCIKKDPESRITQVLFAPLSPNTLPSTTRPFFSTNFVVNGTVYATQVGYNTTAGTVRYTFPYYTLEPKNGSVISYTFPAGNGTYGSITKDLEEDRVYSSFIIDTIGSVKVVMVNDDLEDPTPGKVKIRFFNFCPNAPALDVVVQGATNKLFTNRSYNDQATTPTHENFIEIDAGNYTFLFNNAATGATVYTTSVQALLPDRIYTLAARGVIGNATSPVGAWVYPNKP